MSEASSSRSSSLREAGFRGRLLEEEPLAAYTTWRIGGPAELLAAPSDREDLLRAVFWARVVGIGWRLLGNGSNLLVRDEGVRGLVLHTRPGLDRMTWDGPVVHAEAGVSFPALANAAAGRGLSGLEFAAGIPGTLGGAIVMNAGWHEHEIGAVVHGVEFLEPGGRVQIWPRARCAFGYRTSAFRGRPGVVLGAVLHLRPEDPSTVRGRQEAYVVSRRASQPTELPSCGSVFLKPEGDFAGRLIEEAGLKGLRVGRVQVSPKHANFFVNLGGATAADALELIEHVERAVQSRFGIRLVREVEIW